MTCAGWSQGPATSARMPDDEPHGIEFHWGGREVGRLTWDEGHFRFEAEDAEESAIVFMRSVGGYIDRHIAARLAQLPPPDPTPATPSGPAMTRPFDTWGKVAA